MHRAAFVTLAALLLAGCAGNDDTGSSSLDDADAAGITVGAQAPDVTFYDADANPVTLASLYEEGPIVLVFYRGGWCPFCTRTLRDWRDNVDELSALGARLVAVTPESPDNFARTVAKNNLDYLVLGDPDFDAAKAFEVYQQLDEDEQANYLRHGVNVAEANASNEWALPAPGTYIIDQSGTIRYAEAHWDYKKRADPDDVIAALERIEG